jgi:uncharacterized protein (DUF486 family)
MTLAWYGQLHFRSATRSLVLAVGSWITFVEYRLAGPANRLGRSAYSAAELNTMQEVISLVVFALISWLSLHEPLHWNHALGFPLVTAGTAVLFRGRSVREGPRPIAARTISAVGRAAQPPRVRSSSVRQWAVSSALTMRR